MSMRNTTPLSHKISFYFHEALCIPAQANSSRRTVMPKHNGLYFAQSIKKG